MLFRPAANCVEGLVLMTDQLGSGSTRVLDSIENDQ
jgi:hypothetical protein